MIKDLNFTKTQLAIIHKAQEMIAIAVGKKPIILYRNRGGVAFIGGDDPLEEALEYAYTKLFPTLQDEVMEIAEMTGREMRVSGIDVPYLEELIEEAQQIDDAEKKESITDILLLCITKYKAALVNPKRRKAKNELPPTHPEKEDEDGEAVTV